MNGDTDEMTTVRAVKAHEIPGHPPIQVAVGQRVQVGGQDTIWPAFVFVTTDDGSGWVPARHIEPGSKPAVDLRDVQIAARHADPRTTMRYDRARKNLDRHPNYILAAYMASGT
jgi:hypothetical protein